MFNYWRPKYLSHDLERIQKRALAITGPGLNYNEELTRTDLVPVNEHHRNLYNSLFNDILNNKSHRLRYFLPPLLKDTRYTLRHTKTFDVPKVKTNRAKNTFILSRSLACT